jgi:uncharacterized repeat protein (TIGR03837 family)
VTSLSDKAGTPARWDLFCRVIDNLGDAAVAWRLARQLAREHGVAVRLWIDAPQTLSRLVPAARVARTHEGVRIEHWLETAAPLKSIGPAAVADVVIACFGCELPPSYRVAMRTRRPVWVNLEYLSAEDWVDSHHGLASPKSDGLTEWFFFPGFRPGTGGLLREADLIERRDAFRSDPWARTAFLSKLGITARPTDRFASLFCYPDSAITELAQAQAQGFPWQRLRDGTIAGSSRRWRPDHPDAAHGRRKKQPGLLPNPRRARGHFPDSGGTPCGLRRFPGSSCHRDRHRP